jgi:hypothetical protein
VSVARVTIAKTCPHILVNNYARVSEPRTYISEQGVVVRVRVCVCVGGGGVMKVARVMGTLSLMRSSLCSA